MKWIRFTAAVLFFAALTFGFSHRSFAAQYTIHALTTGEAGTPWADGLNRFADLVKKRTNGDVDVQVFVGGKLGDKKITSQVTMLQMAAADQLELASVSTTPVGNIDPEFALFDLPFLFRDYDQAFKVVNGPIGRSMLDHLSVSSGHHLMGLAFGDAGFMTIYTSNKPIRHPQDLSGMRLRTLESQISLETYKQLGTTPVPVPIQSLQDSVKKGYVQGVATGMGVYGEFPVMREAFHVINDVRLSYIAHLLIMSGDFFRKLPEKYQEVIMKSSAEAMRYEQKRVQDYKNDVVKKAVKENGATTVTLTPSEREKFESYLQPVYTKFVPIIGEELVDKVKALR